MNYLLCMFLLSATMLFFLRVIRLLETGGWPENSHTLLSVLRELLLRHRLFR